MLRPDVTGRKIRLIPLVLLFLMPSLLCAQGVKVGVRLDGGAQYSLGGGLSDASAQGPTAVQPIVGGGVYLRFASRVRAGVDYSYTRMVREQVNGTLTQLPGGGVEGEVYRDLKTHFHGAAVSGEFNVLPAGIVSLDLGAGAGALFAQGKTYTIGVSNEVKPGGTGNLIHISGHNVGHNYVAPFIPLTLSLEIQFLPQVAVSLGGGYRFVLAGSQALAPKGQAYGTLGLRFNL